MRTFLIICLLVLSIIVLQAQQGYNFIRLDFPEGDFHLNKEHLNQLGRLSDILYGADSIVISSSFISSRNIQKKENDLLNLYDELLRFFREENIVLDIVTINPPVRSVEDKIEITCHVPVLSPSINNYRDTSTVHADGFRIEYNIINHKAIQELQIKTIQIQDMQTTSAIESISSRGEYLSLVSAFQLKEGEQKLQDTSRILLPIPEEFSNAKLLIFRLNTYTNLWEQIKSGVYQKKVGKFRFLSMPFTGSGIYSLQQIISGEAIPVVFSVPVKYAINTGTFKSAFPHIYQTGQISDNQTEIKFLIPKKFSFVSLDIIITDPNQNIWSIDQSWVEKIISDKIKNYKPGDLINICINKSVLTERTALSQK